MVFTNALNTNNRLKKTKLYDSKNLNDFRIILKLGLFPVKPSIVNKHSIMVIDENDIYPANKGINKIMTNIYNAMTLVSAIPYRNENIPTSVHFDFSSTLVLYNHELFVSVEYAIYTLLAMAIQGDMRAINTGPKYTITVSEQ